MIKSPLVICDKYGWPVTYCEGRPIQKILRFLILGRKLRRGKVLRARNRMGPTCWKPDIIDEENEHLWHIQNAEESPSTPNRK